MWKVALIAGLVLAAVAAITAVAVSCGSRDGASDDPAAAGTYRQISQEDARERMEKDDGHLVVDVRTQEEYDEGHLPDAVLIPNESIGTEKPAELPDLDQILLIYCRTGRRSKEAAQKLADLGYRNVYEFGGIEEWTGDVVQDIRIRFAAEIEKADVWIMPDSDLNRRKSLWGTATVSELDSGSGREVTVPKSRTNSAFLVRAIDADQMYYLAKDVVLEDGYSVTLRKGDDSMSFRLEVEDADGRQAGSYEIFAAHL